MQQDKVSIFETKGKELISLSLEIVMEKKKASGKGYSPVYRVRDSAVVTLDALINIVAMLFRLE